MDPAKTIELATQLLGLLGALLMVVNLFNPLIARYAPRAAEFLRELGPHVQGAYRALKPATKQPPELPGGDL